MKVRFSINNILAILLNLNKLDKYHELMSLLIDFRMFINIPELFKQVS